MRKAKPIKAKSTSGDRCDFAKCYPYEDKARELVDFANEATKRGISYGMLQMQETIYIMKGGKSKEWQRKNIKTCLRNIDN